MKTPHFIPPVAALLIAIAWLGVERRTLARLEEENTVLRKHIAAAREAAATDGGANSSAAANAKKPDELDWKKIADQLGSMERNGGMPDMRAMIRLQQQIMSMESEQLAAALDEIAALDLDGDQRMMLEQMLLGIIAQKDPELALTRFLGRVGDQFGAVNWQLAHALGTWAEKDPAAATAWFDREIAKGSFESKSLDGKDGPRPKFESALIGVLIKSNPAAAGSRLAALPAEQRVEALNSVNVAEDEQKALVGLIRGSVPEEEQAELVANQMNRFSHNGDYESMTAYLERIEATPSERAACVDEAADSRFLMLSRKGGITREKIDEFRTWADSASEGSADRATGKAIASAMNMGKETSFSELAALAKEYHAESGSDELLIPLADHWRARTHKEEARELAGLISDETRREEILENLK